ncbi:metal-sensitive transcriptional regulator [Brevibacterium samyangense]|uniref:Metal-sensitive transcriptional regulator n=1 Tax=Brevibacterium samyangense TaxID=366888 RepID=A0ABN2T498_9MICO
MSDSTDATSGTRQDAHPAPGHTAGAVASEHGAAAHTEGGHATHGYTENKDAYRKRLKRIEGQVRGIARMIDEDIYCIDILTQVSAVTAALRSVSIALLDEHMKHCVVTAANESPEAAAAKIDEATKAIARLVKS